MARPTLRLFDGYASTSPHLNDDVRELQRLLKNYGYRIKVDGEFGPYTENVVRLFQASKGASADGVVGPSTWAMLLRKPQPQSAGGINFQTSFAKWDKQLIKQLEELKKYEGTVRKVSKQYDIPPAVIAGIGSRESHWGLALTPPTPAGTGDHGHGRGLMQVDDRWHKDFIASGKWSDPHENIIYGGAVLKTCMDYMRKRGNLSNKMILIRGGVAGYNCGPRRVLEAYQAGQDLDYYTTGRDYSRDVLNRSGWFQLHGF